MTAVRPGGPSGAVAAASPGARARPSLAARGRRALSGRAAAAAALLALVALSAWLRTRTIDAPFWIDEGLSVGISSHALLDIPELLLQDGSPPLYYLMLHGWMKLFGQGEAATHALSVLFGLLLVPAGLWAGWSLFGRSAGLICAALCALSPFATAYAQETRMYSLMILLGLVATGAFLHVFVYRRRGYLLLWVVALTLMLYTHNWAFFFTAGALAALLPCYRRCGMRRALARDALLAFAIPALLFAPWLPSLIEQILHTGAPWSTRPTLYALFVRAPGTLVGGPAAAAALVLGGGAGLLAALRRRQGAERTAALALVLVPVVGLLSAWLMSQVSPAWAHRYLTALLGPLLLLFALGLARAGRLGVAALAIIAVAWVAQPPFEDKSNARQVVARAATLVRPGDLVISTHPEQVAVLDYYLPDGLRYATPLGAVPDARVMDWRDALQRLERVTPAAQLTPLLDELPVGTRVLLVRPLIGEGIAWDAPWTRLVRRRSAEWGAALGGDARFERGAVIPRVYPEELPRGVRAVLYTKTRRLT